MNMSKEEVKAIMSLAGKIIQHENDKKWLQDLQDESDAEWNSEEYVKNENSDLETIRKSEDQYDITDSSKPRPGNCECCDD